MVWIYLGDTEKCNYCQEAGFDTDCDAEISVAREATNIFKIVMRMDDEYILWVARVEKRFKAMPDLNQEIGACRKFCVNASTVKSGSNRKQCELDNAVSMICFVQKKS